MKKLISMFICCLLLTSLIANTAFAYPKQIENYSFATEMVLLPPSVKSSRAYVSSVLKGNFFAAGEINIINEDGNIGVSAKTYMRKPIDSLYMTIYLDREVDGKWKQVETYEFEFQSKDYPDGMYTPGVDFTILNQPKGYYYRVRGVYLAFLDGASEGFGPATNGVLIH